MKKFFLTVAVACCSFAMQAQLSATSTHLDSVYYLWNSHKRLTVDHKPTLITFDFSDTTTMPFSKLYAGSLLQNNTVIRYSWDATEKALKVDIAYARHSDGNSSNVLGFDWTNWVKAETSERFNPFINADDYVEGIFLDMSAQSSRELVMNAKAVDLSDSATVSFCLLDANGRVSDFKRPQHTIKSSNTYSESTYKWNVNGQSDEWNQDVNELIDGYTYNYLGVQNGRSDVNNENKSVKLPVIAGSLVDKIKKNLSQQTKIILETAHPSFVALHTLNSYYHACDINFV